MLLRDWLHFISSTRRASLFPNAREVYLKRDASPAVLNYYVDGAYGQPGSPMADRIALRLILFGSSSFEQYNEACAISVMHAMLEDYSEETGAPFADALCKFAESSAYEMLFDLSTGLWQEGPDYLRSIFDRTYPISG